MGGKDNASRKHNFTSPLFFLAPKASLAFVKMFSYHFFWNSTPKKYVVLWILFQIQIFPIVIQLQGRLCQKSKLYANFLTLLQTPKLFR